MRKSLFILSVFLTLSAVSVAQNMKDGFVTYTMQHVGDENGQKTKFATPDWTFGDHTYPVTENGVTTNKSVVCTAVQGMAVGRRYAYVAKVFSSSNETYGNKVGVIWRIDLETGRRVLMQYQAENAKDAYTGPANDADGLYYEYCQILGHANELEVVEHPTGDTELFVSTMHGGNTGGFSIARFAVLAGRMYLMGCYQTKLGDAAKGLSAMKHIKTDDTNMYFLAKSGLDFFTVKIPLKASGTTTTPAEINIYKLFTTTVNGVKFVKDDNAATFTESSLTDTEIKRSSSEKPKWSNQGFGYSAEQKVLYVPIWRNTNGRSKTNMGDIRSVILTYNIAKYVKETAEQEGENTVKDYWDATPAQNAEVETLKPTKTALWVQYPVTDKTYYPGETSTTNQGCDYEIESASFCTGTTDRLYFNVNLGSSSTMGSDGIWVVDMPLVNFEPLDAESKYTIIYKQHGLQSTVGTLVKDDGTEYTEAELETLQLVSGEMENTNPTLGSGVTLRPNEYDHVSRKLEYAYTGAEAIYDPNDETKVVGAKNYGNKTCMSRTISYSHDGWYAHRHSDNKWLYDVSGNFVWCDKGEQPDDAFLALLPKDYTSTDDLTEMANDVIVLYAFWKPEGTGQEDAVPDEYKNTHSEATLDTYRNDHNWYFVRYDGNGGYAVEPNGTDPTTGKMIYKCLYDEYNDTITLLDDESPMKFLANQVELPHEILGIPDGMGETVYPHRQVKDHPFSRDGYEFMGWNAFRYHYGYKAPNTDEIEQWAYIRMKSNGLEKSGEPWYKLAKKSETSGQLLLKTYGNNAKTWTTTTVDGDVVTFYANWGRLINEVAPQGSLPHGVNFTVAGTIDCTTDLHSFKVQILQGETLVQEYDEKLYKEQTSISQYYTNGIDISNATKGGNHKITVGNNSIMNIVTVTGTDASGNALTKIDFSKLAEGDYTYKVLACPMSSGVRTVELYSSDFTISNNAYRVTIPSEKNSGVVVELANPTYRTRGTDTAPDGRWTNPTDPDGNTLDEKYVFNAKLNNWYEFTDPQRVGHTFMGWKSLYVTNNQYLLTGSGTASFSKTTPTEIKHTNVTDYNSHIGDYLIDSISGHTIDEFTEDFTVNVWAYMDNWNDFSGNHRILSARISETDVTALNDGSTTAKKEERNKKRGGWNMGTTESKGWMQWQIYAEDEDPDDDNGKYSYRSVQFSQESNQQKWTELGTGKWHMFTFTYGKYNNTYFGTGYLDVDDKIRRTNDGSGNRPVSKIYYKDDASRRLLVGGEVNIAGDKLGTGMKPFSGGQISNLVVSKINLANYSTDDAKDIISARFGGDNRYKTYLYASDMQNGEYVLQPIWEQNIDTRLLFDNSAQTPLRDNNVSFAEVEGATVKTADLHTSQEYAGVAAKLGHPKRKDYRFVNYTNTASHYVSNHQGLSYMKNSTDTAMIFTCPAAGGETNEVTFDGQTCYFLKHYIDNGTDGNNVDDSDTCKYTDCFTVNVWATMLDWKEYADGNLLMFGCNTWNEDPEQRGSGFNIERNNKVTIPTVDFIGWDGAATSDTEGKKGKFQKAQSDVTWESLTSGDIAETDSDEDKYKKNWHMFTYVFDGSYIRGYIDGVCVAISERFAEPCMGYSNNTITLGARAGFEPYSVYSTSSQYFKGKMKNFALMHIALAPSQVHTLYNDQKANKKQVHYYYAPFDHTDNVSSASRTVSATTLGAVWEKLDPLAANPIEIHAIAGDEVTVDFPVMDDGEEITHSTLEDATNFDKYFKFTDPTVVGEKAKITYTPETKYDAANNKHTTTYKVSSEGWTNSASANITAYTHRFDIAYWNKEGFAVQADEALAKPADGTMAVSLKPVGSENATVGKFTERKDGVTETMYSIALPNAQDLSDTEVEITFTYTHNTDAKKNWTATTRRWVPKYINQNNVTDLTDGVNFKNPYRDVVIAGEGVVLNADLTGEKKLGDLYVQPDASFTLGMNGKIEADALVIYSEYREENGGLVGYTPNVSIPAGKVFNITNKRPTVYYVKRIKKAGRWYMFSLPYDCNIEDIHFADGTGEVYKKGGQYKEESIYIQEFDGEYRAKEQNINKNWFYLDANETKLHAGRGYSITMDGSNPNDWVDIVFPMHVSGAKDATEDVTLNLHEKDNPSSYLISVDSHTTYKDENPKANEGYFGWNLVGLPYLGHYAYPKEDANTLHKLGHLTIGTDGKADETGMTYLTIPIDGSSSTYQTVYRSHPIVPFSPFFVQVAEKNSSVLFTPPISERSIVARRKSAAEVLQRTFVGVTLSGANYTDETALVVGNQFTQAYEIGSDLEKMLGTGAYPQVYINDASNRYAFKSLSVADAAGTNKLGVYLPTNGEYTFAVNESFDLSGIQTVHLTDYQEGVTVNLLNSPYTFTSGAVHTTSRFALSAVLSADVATDLTSGTAIAWAVWQDAPLHIQVQGLAVGDEVRIYDTMGHLIMQSVATDTTAAFALPAEGAYCIQTVGAQGSQVKKMMIK